MKLQTKIVVHQEVSKHPMFTLSLTLNKCREGERKDNGGDNGV